MDDTEYSHLATQVLKTMAIAVDRQDPDLVEADLTGDMLTITAGASGEKVVVNTQKAAHQIWVAGRGLGVHFSASDDGKWRDDKGRGIELFAWVKECVRDATGCELDYSSSHV